MFFKKYLDTEKYPQNETASKIVAFTFMALAVSSLLPELFSLFK